MERIELQAQIPVAYQRKRTHYLALILGVLLIILIIATFITFAFGAYTVFNEPNSNVIAITKSENGTTLFLSGSNFYPNASRYVWIDPKFSGNLPGLLNTSSGYVVGTVRTNSAGAIISQSYRISDLLLTQIGADGSVPHSVWVIGSQGNVSIGKNTFFNMSSDSQKNYSSSSMGSGVYFFVTLLVINIPISFTFGQLFIVLWIIYILLFAVALNGPFRNILGSLKDTSKEGLSGLLKNSSYAMFMVFSVALWGSVLLAELQQSAGIPTGNLPPTDPLVEFVELAIAPLREEIGFRVIPIGVVALLILFSKRRVRDGVLALWHPSRYLKKNDTPYQYKSHQMLMYILIVISSILFGAAHVLLGVGWDIGKVSQAAGVGLALGVLYYRYGFAAAVLLHWSFDYVVGAYALNNYFLNAFIYYELLSAVVAVASTIALISLLVGRLRRRPPPIL